MAIDDGLDQVQAEPHPLLIKAAGAVGFMEAVENKGQVVGRDGLADIAHGNESLFLVLVQAQRQAGTGICELHGVIQQIVDHARNGVLVRHDHDAVVGKLGIHVQVLFCGPVFEAQKRLQNSLKDIVLALRFRKENVFQSRARRDSFCRCATSWMHFLRDHY